MSFILDALKKSEAERQRQAGPALLEMRIVRPVRHLPVWASVLGLLLIMTIAVLGWLAWHRASSAAAPATGTTPAGTTNPGAISASLPESPTPSAAIVAAPATVPVAPEPQPLSDEVNPNPADVEPATMPVPGVPHSDGATSNLRNYAELSGTPPDLRLDLHVYAANASDRYAFINMHKVHEGDTTQEGVQVKEITREGVVLDFRGTEFLLGRQ